MTTPDATQDGGLYATRQKIYPREIGGRFQRLRVIAVFVLLVVCLRVVGVTSSEITVVEAFAAWALVRILGALPLTPAGGGIVEIGLTGALVAFGAPNAEAVTATLLYRALTVFPTLALGLTAAATWRTHHPGESIESRDGP